jgi:hypothetical protein
MSTELIIAIFENDEAKADDVMKRIKELTGSKALKLKKER